MVMLALELYRLRQFAASFSTYSLIDASLFLYLPVRSSNLMNLRILPNLSRNNGLLSIGRPSSEFHSSVTGDFLAWYTRLRRSKAIKQKNLSYSRAFNYHAFAFLFQISVLNN